MKMYRTSITVPSVLFLWLFLGSVNVFSQERLTMKDAINYALENKANAQKARLITKNAENQIAEVRSQALPQVSLSGNLIYNPILQETALPGEIIGQPGTTLMVPFGQSWMALGGINVFQNVFNYSVFTGLKAAKSTREFYKINQQLTEEEVIEAVANGYYQVFMAKEKLSTIKSTLENTERVQNTIEGLYTNGLAKKIDLDRIKVNVANLKSVRNQLDNVVKLQENMLKFLIGMPINTPIILEEETIRVTLMDPEAIDVKDLSPYQLLEAQQMLLTYNMKAIEAGYYPTLSLSGNYSYQGLGDKFPLSDAKPADGVFWGDYAQVTLNLNIPLFTGFSTRSKVRKAQYELDILDQDMKDAELALNVAFENAKSQLNNSVLTIESQKKNVQLAQEVFDNTENNYSNGLASLTELIDAENALTEAKNNLSNALLEYKLAEIQLVKSQGKLHSFIN